MVPARGAARSRLGAWLLAGLLLPPGAAAQEQQAIELADDPFEITDPYAAAPGSAELGVIGLYERARSGRVRDTVGLETELQLGLARRLELRIGQAGAHGNLEARRRLDEAGPAEDAAGDDAAQWGGATRIGLLYQLTPQRGAAPAVAALARLRRVYGPGLPAWEGDAVLLAGTTLGRAARPLGLHLNLGWTARLDPLPGERPGRPFLNATIGQAATLNTALVLTYAWERQERDERDYQLVQAGLRHRPLPGGPVLGLALGAGIGADSPAFQLAFAVQWSLGGEDR